MRRQATDGSDHASDAYVFGDEVGGRIKDVKTAWGAACRRAGITDLHFHDLRRECGSRWVEAGVSLVQVQAWLGHTNISQTSTYLRVSPAGTDEALRRIEAFDAARFAHDSHTAGRTVESAESADQAQPVVM
jgi:integrase